MIPTKERKRVARPKITKNKSCIRKTKKKGFKIRIVSKMKKEIGKLVLVQERISEKGVKIETSEKKSEKGPRIRKEIKTNSRKISSDQNS